MLDLKAISPFQGLTPRAAGRARMSAAEPGRLTAILPRKGQESAFAARLQAAHGLAPPAPMRITEAGGARALWFGREAILLMGPAPDPGLAEHAVLADQSDAWAALRLEGGQAGAVLARLVPLDLRAGVFLPGHTARTELRQMMAALSRLGEEEWLIMVGRSFARRLWHEVRSAMEGVAARGAR